MVGFPYLPKVRGDTDDEASIHLFSKVGPAKPIRRNYEKEINSILSRPASSLEDEDSEKRNSRRNAKFRLYANRELNDVESGDETHVEIQHVEPELLPEPQPVAPTPIPKKRIQPSKRRHMSPTLSKKALNLSLTPSKKALISLWDPKILGFLIGFGLLFLLPNPFTNKPTNSPIIENGDLAAVSARIDIVDQRVSALNDISLAHDKQIELINQKQESFISTISQEISSLDDQVVQLRQSIPILKLSDLEEDMAYCKSKIKSLQFMNGDSSDLEEKVLKISQSLAHFSTIESQVLSIKKQILSDLILQLPEHVPIYVKDRRIHYLPEFHSFLRSFVEKFGSSAKQTWPSFMEDNGKEFKDYVDKLMHDENIKFVTKSEFESTLHEKLSHQNHQLLSKVHQVLDQLQVNNNATHIDLSKSKNKIVLQNLLDVVAKGSLRVNYADYNLGSRILGFLTSTGGDSFKRRSLLRVVFLGFYDYLKSSGLRAPTEMKFNANNVLVDDGAYWQCESDFCTLGIRLSSPIILTDLVFENPSEGRPQGLEVPDFVSVYVKPRKRSDAQLLEQYVNLRRDFSTYRSENKYLKKFYKIQEIQINSSLQHVRLPASIVNMRLSIRDVYFELRSRRGVTGLYNVKAYGISEINSYRYAEKFQSVLDGLDDTEDEQYFHSLMEQYGSTPAFEDDYSY